MTLQASAQFHGCNCCDCSHLVLGDIPFLREDPVPGGRLQSMLDAIIKYGQDTGIMRLHLLPFIVYPGRVYPLTLVIVTDPDMVSAILS